jgi:hypothetical protein
MVVLLETKKPTGIGHAQKKKVAYIALCSSSHAVRKAFKCRLRMKLHFKNSKRVLLFSSSSVSFCSSLCGSIDSTVSDTSTSISFNFSSLSESCAFQTDSIVLVSLFTSPATVRFPSIMKPSFRVFFEDIVQPILWTFFTHSARTILNKV